MAVNRIEDCAQHDRTPLLTCGECRTPRFQDDFAVTENGFVQLGLLLGGSVRLGNRALQSQVCRLRPRFKRKTPARSGQGFSADVDRDFGGDWGWSSEMRDHLDIGFQDR